MSTLLFSHLRQTLGQLNAQNSTTFSVLDKQRLQQMLTATINTLRSLYPDHLSYPQRFQLLQNLMLLEQQSAAIGPMVDAAFTAEFTTWQAIRESLIASIETTLTDEARPLR